MTEEDFTVRNSSQSMFSKRVFSSVAIMKVLMYLFVCVVLLNFFRGINCPYLLVHTPDTNNSQVWAEAKLGARKSIQVSYMDGRNPSTSAITSCVPRCTLAKSWNRSTVRFKPRHSGCPNQFLNPNLKHPRSTKIYMQNMLTTVIHVVMKSTKSNVNR